MTEVARFKATALVTSRSSDLDKPLDEVQLPSTKEANRVKFLEVLSAFDTIKYEDTLKWLPKAVRTLAYPTISNGYYVAHKELYSRLLPQTFVSKSGTVFKFKVSNCGDFSWSFGSTGEEKIVSCSTPLVYELELAELCKDFREATCDYLRERCDEQVSIEENELIGKMDVLKERIVNLRENLSATLHYFDNQ